VSFCAELSKSALIESMTPTAPLNQRFCEARAHVLIFAQKPDNGEANIFSPYGACVIQIKVGLGEILYNTHLDPSNAMSVWREDISFPATAVFRASPG
jgi:hypothetical protein